MEITNISTNLTNEGVVIVEKSMKICCSSKTTRNIELSSSNEYAIRQKVLFKSYIITTTLKNKA